MCSIIQSLFLIPELIKIKEGGLTKLYKQFYNCINIGFYLYCIYYIHLRLHNFDYSIYDENPEHGLAFKMSILHLLLIIDFVRRFSFYCKITDKFG